MRTAEQAWNLVTQNTKLIDVAVSKVPKIAGVQPQELQSYAVESAFRAAKSWDPERGEIEPFLYRAASTGAIDGLREQGRFYGWSRTGRKFFIEVPGDDPVFWERVAGEVDSDEVVAYLSLMELLEPLTERQRQVAYLRFVEQWTPKEIGELLGVTNKTVTATEHQLAAKLRERLTRRGSDGY